MIDPETGRLGFRIGIFVAVIGVWLLFITEPGSASFYADVVAVIVAVIFLVILALMVRRHP